jgi:four helix bundle protein
MSISANIAEGDGKTGISDKRRYSSIARGSALESAALFDVIVEWQPLDEKPLVEPRALLERITAMLGALTTRS